MDLCITELNESVLYKHHQNGTKESVVITADSYPKIQAFLKECCEMVQTSSVTVLDKYLGYELFIQVPDYEGELMPNAATVLYSNPGADIQGYELLTNEVKAELDALVALIP